MATPRKTASATPTTSSIPIPARITAKPTIPRPPASSSSKISGIKPKAVLSTSIHEAQAASSTRSTTTPAVNSVPSTARTRTTSSSARGVSTASLTSGKTLPVPKSPAARHSKTPSPSKTRPTPLNSPQARRPVSPSPQPFEIKAPPLSVREAIALKRAEAKKAQLSATKTLDRQKSSDNFTSLDEFRIPTVVNEVELSRWSIRESIERAKSSGSLNLSSRSLYSIPSLLFEVHLGITPEPLQDVPKESEEVLMTGKTKEREEIPWFEVVDLTVMKLRDNMILKLQPEISLFGSLRTLELRNNRLKFLPDSISDLVNLVSLDVSANQLTSLPPGIASLPLLSTLDASSNQLTSLPLTILSTPVTSPVATSFFSPVTISRASRPLPSLRQLLASNNQISAVALPTEDLPPELSKLDLSHNPLGNGTENKKASKQFVQLLSKLSKLKQLMLEGSQLDDGCFDFTKIENGKNKLFGALELVDLGKTAVTEQVEALFNGRPVSFEGEAIDGGIRIILGNRIQKEAWEIEAEKRIRKFQPKTQAIKEDWEVEAELGLSTAIGRRQAGGLNATVGKLTDDFTASDMPPTPPKSPISPTRSTGSHGNGQSLANYYASTSQTLTLPKALPLGHNRTRSLAVASSAGNDRSDPIVPNQTLPLSLILVQPFARTLTCLILSNRRADSSFVVPETFFAFLASPANNLEVETEPYFPYLEELRLDGCLLGDVVNISSASTAQTRKEPLFNVIDHLFPTLSILDLCDNRLTHLNGISSLLIPAKRKSLFGSRRMGLKALRLRGNKLADLSNLEDVAGVLRREGKVEGWRLEELDLRENEIAKLPPVLGFLPLDVMLVESNIFRAPSRRVWEVEGTKGLLQWLKGRADS